MELGRFRMGVPQHVSMTECFCTIPTYCVCCFLDLQDKIMQRDIGMEIQV